jgi:hypothetical protein
MPKKMAVDTKKKNVVKKLVGTKKEAVKVLKALISKEANIFLWKRTGTGVPRKSAKAELLKNRKAIVEKAGLKLDLEAEAKWLEMSDDVFDFAIKQLSDIKNVSTATSKVEVPDVHAPAEKSARDIVRDAFNERKQSKKR